MKTKNVDIQWYENFDYIREFPLYNLAGPPSQGQLKMVVKVML